MILPEVVPGECPELLLATSVPQLQSAGGVPDHDTLQQEVNSHSGGESVLELVAVESLDEGSLTHTRVAWKVKAEQITDLFNYIPHIAKGGKVSFLGIKF